MKELVLEAINERLKDFESTKSLKSLYKTELDTNKGYDGRQLLEMFQNCEDEGAKTVEIYLDTERRTLRISNDGPRSFSLKGYDSLLYPGLTSKVSSDYIGNKGLGFRSIINWAEEIRIISNDFILEFKESNKKKVLLEDLNFSEEQLDEIRNERAYHKDVYPIPLLNCGKILELKYKHDYTTSIEVVYKNGYEEDIINQIKGISEETLIFINNLNTVIFSGNTFNKKIEVVRSSTAQGKLIKSKNNTYYILEDEGVIDQDFTENSISVLPQKYSVKIAYSDNLDLNGTHLFNYFKTQIPFQFPFIAHASLELDQNRNHATAAKENTFVFKKLVELHLKFVEVIKTRYQKSWLPYRSIATEMYDTHADYTELLNENWEQMAVYPTFSGNYVTKDIAKYISNTVASFIENTNVKLECLSNIVIKCDDDLKALDYIVAVEDKKAILEEIAIDFNISDRAKFIKLILSEFSDLKLSILIDNKGKLIKCDDYVFTDKTAANKDLAVPSYSNIRFINSELYVNLVDVLDIRSLGDDISRSLADVLSKISDVHSFEPQTVIKKIITETNHIINDTADKIGIVKELYKVLFYNYCLREDNPRLDFSAMIPALNQDLEIVDIKTLAFSKNYRTGKKSFEILGEINSKKNTIADPQVFGEFQDTLKFEEFLSWLGVNDCFIFETLISKVDQIYLHQATKYTEWKAITSYSLYTILNFQSIFTSQNINQLILWLSYDKQFRYIFKNFTFTASKEEELYYGKNKKKQGNFANYIHYQIENTLNVKNYLLTSKRSEWFNPFVVNYEYLIANNPELTRQEVDRILKFFGAKESFVNLEIFHLESKLNDLALRKNHNGAQLFYKNLVGHYKTNGKTFNNPLLYARKGDDIVIEKAENIYFSDRILLPTNLTKVFPILYYPSRAGGASAIKLFGLNDLNTLDFKIENEPTVHVIQKEFEEYIKEIIPFILSFRLDKLSNQESKDDQVRKLNGLKVICCSEIECSIEANRFAVEDLNYIISNETYYFKISQHVTIDFLRKNKIFADNLSDLFLKLFDINDEKRLFETIIRQSKEDNHYDIENNLGLGVYDEALTLLGQISTRLSIWKAIFKLKNCDFLTELNENNLDTYIDETFREVKGLQRFYSNNTIDELQLILDVFRILDIDLYAFNKISEVKISFSKIFNIQLQDFYNSKKKFLKNSIWYNLSLKGRNDQMQFLVLLKQVETILEFDNGIYENLYPNFKDILNDLISQVFTVVKPDIDFIEDINFNEISKENELSFSEKQLNCIKQDIKLESLKYFKNNIDFLQGQADEILKLNINKKSDNDTFTLEQGVETEFIEEYDFEKSSTDLYRKSTSIPWLASRKGELSDEDKKRLGNEVEDIVFNYLVKQDNVSNVDHVAKTDEGLHYDISYYCLMTNQTKFVECKYYNGRSFILTADEKDFGYENKDYYEIWLVDKNSKIYPIKNIMDLGELRAKDYFINFKIKLKTLIDVKLSDKNSLI